MEKVKSRSLQLYERFTTSQVLFKEFPQVLSKWCCCLQRLASKIQYFPKLIYISNKFHLSAICSLIFLQSKGMKRQTLSVERERKIICFIKDVKELRSLVSRFAIIYSLITPWERAGHPRYFKKRSVGLQNLMFRKCYFQIQEKSLTERNESMENQNCVVAATAR